MTNDQGAKSQKERNTEPAFVWDLVIGAWDLIGIWSLGHWDFAHRPQG
jgi:hypothetical protein